MNLTASASAAEALAEVSPSRADRRRSLKCRSGRQMPEGCRWQVSHSTGSPRQRFRKTKLGVLDREGEDFPDVNDLGPRRATGPSPHQSNGSNEQTTNLQEAGVRFSRCRQVDHSSGAPPCWNLLGGPRFLLRASLQYVGLTHIPQKGDQVVFAVQCV